MLSFSSCLFLDTGKTKCLHTSKSNLTGASTISQSLSLGPPFPFAACTTFVPQLDLYKRKGQVTGNCCSTHFKPSYVHDDIETLLPHRKIVDTFFSFPFSSSWQLKVERMCTLPFHKSADIRACDSLMFSLSY